MKHIMDKLAKSVSDYHSKGKGKAVDKTEMKSEEAHAEPAPNLDALHAHLASILPADMHDKVKDALMSHGVAPRANPLMK